MASVFNLDQSMWVDVIHAVLREEKFNLHLGDMNYVFRNMIAKYASSVDEYYVSEGVEELIDSDPVFGVARNAKGPLNLSKLFYGAKSESSKLGKSTMFEHSIPVAVVRDELIKAREKLYSSGGSSVDFRADVESILKLSGRVVIVLKEEDKRLSRSTMPSNWNYFSDDAENDLVRYRLASPPVNISAKYRLYRDKHISR